MSKKRPTTRKRVTVSIEETVHRLGTKQAKEHRPRLSFSRYVEHLIQQAA